eukprot:11132139-Prorocentrum_lima.AAC.1
MHDLGGKVQGKFTDMAETWHVQCVVRPTEAPWQQAVVERHGAVLGDIVRMAVEEQSIAGVDEMRLVLY